MVYELEKDVQNVLRKHPNIIETKHWLDDAKPEEIKVKLSNALTYILNNYPTTKEEYRKGSTPGIDKLQDTITEFNDIAYLLTTDSLLDKFHDIARINKPDADEEYLKNFHVYFAHSLPCQIGTTNPKKDLFFTMKRSLITLQYLLETGKFLNVVKNLQKASKELSNTISSPTSYG